MDKDTRNAIDRATQRARKLLEDDFAAQLAGDFDVHRDGVVATKAGGHLSARQTFARERIVAAIEHKRAAGMSAADAARDYLRDAAFTTLNRFVALKMLEARDLVQECITKGEQSAGYREFCGMAPGLPLLSDSAGYRLYIESLFDELSTEVKVLFDRRDPSSVLWPKRATFEQLLEILNSTPLARVWGEDETIGWVYQFFNGQAERKKMRKENQAPRNSRDLAVRNQFFTPSYVVQFLTDNTLGRIWYEMREEKTVLYEKCAYMVRRPGEAFAPREKKDPRDLRVLDPACGSGHFLLYAFDLLLAIYEEAHRDAESPKSKATGKTLAEDYATVEALRNAVPGLVLAQNLYGVDIDPRCAQIAMLALWMRAQKAFGDFGIQRAHRMQIRRSNIVVAEPLVADKQIAEEFVEKLGDPELGHLFMALVSSLSLAGEMGLLLRVEKLVNPTRNQGELFAPAQERIRSAIDRFVRENTSATQTRRRLFADDVAHGVALLEIADMLFDTVLMNPPFGAPTESTNGLLAELFPDTKYDIGAAFIEEATGRLARGGYVGAIFNRTNWFLSRLSRFRAKQSREHWLPCNVDLGLGVLDAFVETALTVVAEQRPQGESLWLRVVDTDDKAETLLASIKALSHGENSSRSFAVDQASFNANPTTAFSYWIPPGLLARAGQTSLSSLGVEAKQGLATKDNFRFIRLHWEVSPRDSDWYMYSKGGAYAPFAGSFHLVLDWSRAAQVAFENRDGQFCCLLTGQASRYLFRPGVTYSERTARFSARILPHNSLFDTAGSAVFAPGTTAATNADSEVLALCLLLNTGVAQYIFDLSAGASDEGKARHYSQGMISALPAPLDIIRTFSPVLAAAREVISDIVLLSSTDPTSVYYSGLPTLALSESLSDRIASVVSDARGIQARMDALLRQASELYAASIGIEPGGRTEIVESVNAAHREAGHDALRLERDAVMKRFRQAVLIESLGGNLSVGWTDSVSACLHDHLGAIPWGALACLTGKPGILVDDEGHPASLRDAISNCLQVHGFSPQEIGINDLSLWLRDEAFDEHVAYFSRSKRVAPVLGYFGTPSRKYSVWLYNHAISKDTLFRVQNDYVAPKLAYEERRLETLARGLRDESTAGQRKAIAEQEAVVEELRAFLDEVKRVAPLWKPNLVDGGTVNFAPLYRLVPQNKSWQRELKSTWELLCEGAYDWASLAMHLWPERVVPKCANDRSLAIAHGLEDVFWIEGTGGKWAARETLARSVEELVKERTSHAVKTALKSLLEAPVASGTSTGSKGAGRRKSAGAAEGGDA